MSFIPEFFKSLVPTYERGRLLDTVASTREMLTDSTLPPYQEAVAFGAFKGGTPFKSSQIRAFNLMYMREVDSKHNFIDSTTNIMGRLTNDFAVLSEAVEKHFLQRNNPKLAMSYQHLTFLRLIELIRFAARYSRRVLHYTYMCEAPAMFKQFGSSAQLPKGERKWLEKNAVGYCRTMALLAKPMREILSDIQSMPDVVYDPEQEDAVGAVVGAKKLDPLAMGYIPVISAAFWAIGSRWVEMQAAELEEARAEREMVQLRLAQLKAAQSGDFDAATEKVIKVQQERLDDLTFTIIDLSKRYGVEPAL